MPIYNVEEYLYTFLDSIRKNLCDDIEVILINDGTKDNCGVIIDDFAANNSAYVKVIHKRNGGQSSARNVGIKVAKGDYVICFDPDDYISDTCIKELISAVNKFENPDMIIFDMKIGNNESGFETANITDLEEGIITQERFLYELTKNRGLNSSFANKLIKRSVFNNVMFREGVRYFEDYECMTNIALLMKRVVYVKKVVYYYVMRDDSVTHTAGIKHLIEYYGFIKQRNEKFSSVISQMSIYGLVEAALSVLVGVYKNNINIDVTEQEMLIRKNIFRLLFSSEYNLNEKKKFVLIYLGLAKSYYKSRYHTRCRGCF